MDTLIDAVTSPAIMGGAMCIIINGLDSMAIRCDNRKIADLPSILG